MTSTELILVLIIFFLWIYFLPFVISCFTDHPNKFSLFILNLFLGWTFIGWVISLIWAVYNFEKEIKK